MDEKIEKLIERWKTDKGVNLCDVSQCSLCEHEGFKSTCEAFPDGIPKEILFNGILHNKSIEGDKGIIYKPRKDEYNNINFNSLF